MVVSLLILKENLLAQGPVCEFLCVYMDICVCIYVCAYMGRSENFRCCSLAAVYFVSQDTQRPSGLGLTNLLSQCDQRAPRVLLSLWPQYKYHRFHLGSGDKLGSSRWQGRHFTN